MSDGHSTTPDEEEDFSDYLIQPRVRDTRLVRSFRCERTGAHGGRTISSSRESNSRLFTSRAPTLRASTSGRRVRDPKD